MAIPPNGSKRADHIDIRNSLFHKSEDAGCPGKFRVKKVIQKFCGGVDFNGNTIKRNNDVEKICSTSGKSYYLGFFGGDRKSKREKIRGKVSETRFNETEVVTEFGGFNDESDVIYKREILASRMNEFANEININCVKKRTKDAVMR